MCCQESGEREAVVQLFCPKAKSGDPKVRRVSIESHKVTNEDRHCSKGSQTHSVLAAHQAGTGLGIKPRLTLHSTCVLTGVGTNS